MSGEHGATLLVEIGCEEIPDRMVAAARRDLATAVRDLLVAERLLEKGTDAAMRSFSTPRRLAVAVEGVLAHQPDQQLEVTGPPVSAAFDAAGAPTRAAIGFAASQGVAVDDLHRVQGAKGEVVALSKKVAGRPVATVLGDGLPAAVLGLSFPKTMAWGEGGIEFVRPIRWVVVLHGGDVVPVEIAGIASGRRTWPRRGSGHEPVDLARADEYVDRLLEVEVHADPQDRWQRIHAAVERAGAEAGGCSVGDAELETIVGNLVEYPECLVGSFPEEYLELPAEVLTTTLRHHQRCFSVVDGDGRLKARFVAVVNVPEDITGAIRRGYERVIEGRLDDARFFYREDRKSSLESRLDALRRTRFHAELGSFADKSARLERLVRRLAELADLDEGCADGAARAARLSKCDLATLMENEFPELEGVVGGLYAREEGEPEAVWRAIYDQYRPGGVEDDLPREVEGALLSAADRLDNLVGLMGIGIVPKGSRDPFALRRAALGLVRVLVESPLQLPVRAAVEAALDEYGSDSVEWQVPREEIIARVSGFLEARLRFLFEQAGHRYDSISAVLAAGWDRPALAAVRLQALTAMRGEDDFEALAAASKRIRNILTQAAERDGSEPTADVDEALFEDDAERALHRATENVAGQVRESAASKDHRAALAAIATLRPQVDLFFDNVMVLTEDAARKRNRLALLASIAGLYADLADFAEIVVEGKS